MKLKKITSVCLVLRPRQEKAKILAQEVISWFANKGINAWLSRQNEHGEPSWPKDEQPDLVLVLGGDGTMLGALRAVIGTNIPVLGINLGQVGFLAGLSEQNWQADLQTTLCEGLDLRICRALAWHVTRQGKIIEQGQSINDVVIRSGNWAKLLDMVMHIDNEDVGLLRADGLVVSTPTGSSGYAFSAGGPLLYPEVDAFILAPVCPFLNHMPPFVVNSQKTIVVDIQSAHSGVFLTSDGQEGVPLEPQDKITVNSSGQYAYMGFLPHSSYYAVLRNRGFVKEI